MKQSHRHYEFGTFEERLEHFCMLFKCNKPEILYEDGEPQLTDSLMDWIKENEANMDWLFAGNPSAMLSQWSKEQKRERRIVDLNKKLEPEKQAGFLALLTAVVEHNLPIEEPLQIFDKVVKEWRASKQNTDGFAVI